MSFKINKKDTHYHNLRVKNVVVNELEVLNDVEIYGNAVLHQNLEVLGELKGGSINGNVTLNYISGLQMPPVDNLNLIYTKQGDLVTLRIYNQVVGIHNGSILVSFQNLPQFLRPNTFVTGIVPAKWNGIIDLVRFSIDSGGFITISKNNDFTTDGNEFQLLISGSITYSVL